MLSEAKEPSFFSKSLVYFKHLLMESFYNYYSQNPSEPPPFTSSDIYMIHGRKFSKEETESNSQNKVEFLAFLDAFYSLFWFSYRKDFPVIAPSTWTCDTGWGCMLRSGQMMLSQALACHFLGRDWKRAKGSPENNPEYSRVLRLFDDQPTSPFSVHSIAIQGQKYGKNIGEWFGPSTIAQTLCDLVNTHLSDQLVMYISNDSSLYLDEITKLCTMDNGKSWRPLFIMVPLRLGLQSINEIYTESLKSLFSIPQSLGIVGGKPRAAMYFVAIQDSSLFYLDPHTVQSSVQMTEEGFNQESFHSFYPHTMPLSAVDPSLSIGFYCADKEDFNQFWQQASS
eukprot:TRINITY_DN7686_c0_g1_i1.p1 TRINITY_DN7686_c0_g1~~TRINITY_DN7686_c0_g1_i1.p1  ORF type:complete len:339 (+),score=42.43 TRINITY_DN7686_c0_g1_i1:60-1076(+)